MAAFRTHIAVSSLAGAGYAAFLTSVHLPWPQAALAGLLCAGAGMLPDLDSDTGRPVKELFGVTAAIVPFLLLHRLIRSGMATENIVLVGIGLYLGVRFGAAWIFKLLTVHRGMFHSIPAAIIAAELVFLADNSPEANARGALAGGVFIGYVSHLVLDELYSIDARGLRIRLNRAAGSALKLFSPHVTASLIAWLLLIGLSYLVGIEQGFLPRPHIAANAASPLDRR